MKGDSLYHLAIAREVRKLGRLPATVDRFVFPEVYSYPPLHHLVISKIPQRLDMQTQRIGFAYDALTTFLVGFAGYSLAGWECGVIASVAYLLSPFSMNSLLATSPQPLGVFFVTLFALTSIALTSSLPPLVYWPLFAVAGVAACGSMLSHRSTAQALPPLVVAESVAFGPQDFVGTLVLGFLLALVLLRGRFLHQLREHAMFISLQGRNQLRVLSGFVKQRSPLKALGAYFMPRVAAVNFPLAVLVPFVLVLIPGAPAAYVLWAAGVIAMYLLWLPGRGYRHLAAAVPALCVLAAWSILASPMVAIVLLGIPLALTSLRYLRSVASGRLFVTPAMMSACDVIKDKGSEGDLILVLPYSESYTPLYFTNFRILQGSGGDPRGLIFNRELERKVKERGEILRLVEEYRPLFILKRKDSPTAPPGTVIYENEEFLVLDPRIH